MAANMERTSALSKTFPFEFFYQSIALVLAFILVHSVYVTLVRPAAAKVLQEQTLLIEQDSTYVPERSVYVIIKDYEQESCFILLLWAIAIMGYKSSSAYRQRGLLLRDLVPLSKGISILPEDSREYSRPIQALPAREREYLLSRTLFTALHRFAPPAISRVWFLLSMTSAKVNQNGWNQNYRWCVILPGQSRP